MPIGLEEGVGIVAVLICILIASAVSRRVQGTIVTLPMIYTIFGLLLSGKFLGVIHLELDNELIEIIAEVTLILVLFNDASRIDIRQLIRQISLPTRLLVFGLPAMMILGTIAAALLFTELTFWEAAVLAIILTPTDASLGQAVVSNPKVPINIRQSLNVESGLNDGIAMPFLLLALNLALAEESPLGQVHFLQLALSQIVFGALAGIIIGFLASRFIDWGQDSGWMSKPFQKLSALTLALLAYEVASFVGGNGFIAAFVMGIMVSNTSDEDDSKTIYEFTEVSAQGLIMITFMIVFGAVMLPLALEQLDFTMLLYTILSLAVIRLLAVAISLYRTHEKPITIGFLGWFGPRGIASILYIFIVLEETLTNEVLIYNVVMLTVLISIFAHGITAAPLAKLYGARMNASELSIEEKL